MCRLVLLPHESHGYRGRESIHHSLWETCNWLDAYCKAAEAPTTSDATNGAGASGRSGSRRQRVRVHSKSRVLLVVIRPVVGLCWVFVFILFLLLGLVQCGVVRPAGLVLHHNSSTARTPQHICKFGCAVRRQQ